MYGLRGFSAAAAALGAAGDAIDVTLATALVPFSSKAFFRDL
jgi:hypothetical protein